jgi:tetratricopeptide (TPR) repeat protein
MNPLSFSRHHLPLFVSVCTLAFLLVAGAQSLSAQTANKEAAEKYNEGLNLLKAKDYEGALDVFVETQEIAETAGDKGTASKAENYIYRLCYNVGVGYVKADSLETALEYFEKGIDIEPTYYKNYKGRATVHKAAGDEAAAMEAYIKTAEVASEAGELDERSKALKQAEGFVAVSLQEENYKKVVENGNVYLQFSETATVHYYLSHAYNQLGDHKNALTHAESALRLDQGSRASKAKIHFEMGEAYKNTGQYQNALQSYSEAAYGDFKQRSEHEMEVISGSN